MIVVSNQPDSKDGPSLYELLNDDGKASCDRFVEWVKAGGYAEAAKVFAANEAAIERDLAR